MPVAAVGDVELVIFGDGDAATGFGVAVALAVDPFLGLGWSILTDGLSQDRLCLWYVALVGGVWKTSPSGESGASPGAGGATRRGAGKVDLGLC